MYYIADHFVLNKRGFLLYSHITVATNILDKTAARLFDYKNQLGAVLMGQKQENDVRELHQWAITTLLKIQEVTSSAHVVAFLSFFSVHVQIQS